MSGDIAIAIGAFDGVHRGHAALVAAARAEVGPAGRVLAITFEPHPLAVLRPGRAPQTLSTIEQRREWLTGAGADEVRALAPTREFLEQTPRAFLERLVGEHSPAVVVEGRDFRFGRDRAGSVRTLHDLGPALGFRALVVDDVEAALTDRTSVRVTSSLIRWLAGHGRVRDAGLLLGRPYEIRGEVVRGDGRGASRLDMPTANLDTGSFVVPADGIYAGLATAADGAWHPAAVSIGTKPTFGEHPRVCEAHLIGHDGPPGEYGWDMALRLHEWIRDQIAFEDEASLVDQMHRDLARVREAVPAPAPSCVSSP